MYLYTSPSVNDIFENIAGLLPISYLFLDYRGPFENYPGQFRRFTHQRFWEVFGKTKAGA
jgi:hypothetical protein